MVPPPSRGTFTSTDGNVSSPVAATSLSPEGKSIAQSFMAAASASSTMCTTNSPLRWMLRVVSFGL